MTTLKPWIRAAALAAMTGLGAPLMAAPVSVGVGVDDGFGAGVSGQSGDSIVSYFLADGGNAGADTDVAYHQLVTLNFNYTLPGAVQSASLKIFAGGWGVYGRARVAVNGQFVGLLSDGDDPDNTDAPESAWLDTFNLTPFLALLDLDGSDEVTISVVQAAVGDPAPVFDYGAVDFSVLELTLAGDPGGGSVPEPASLALALFGLAAAGAARARGTR